MRILLCAILCVAAVDGNALVSSNKCDFCRNLVNDVKEQVDNSFSMNAMKTSMEIACSYFPDESSRKECSKVSKLHMDELLQLIASGVDTKQICRLTRMCDETQAKHIFKISRSFTAGDGQYCDTCEEVFGYVKLFMNNNASMMEVESLFENEICPQLGSLSDMCKSVVVQYFPNIWTSILAQLDPAKACTELKLCNSTAGPISAAKLTPAVENVHAGASIECVLCEFVISKLDGMLSENATEQEIIKAVEKVCTFLPSSISSDCDKLVEKYGPAIISLLVNGADPSIVCGFLGLCSSATQNYEKPIRDDKACTICEGLVGVVQTELQNNTTDAEIIKNLDKFCSELFSGSAAQQCTSAVEQKGPAILKMLASKMNPKDVCTMLGICSSETAMKSDGRVHLNRKLY